MITSFISEHTAEFTVVPKVAAALQSTYTSVVPVYFWLSREGGRLAQQVHECEKFRAMALFPRRPKLSHSIDDIVFMTINDAVIETAELLAEHGVPAIAGCPLAYSFWGLGQTSPCAFVRLCQETAPRYALRQETGAIEPDKMVLATDHDLISLVESQADTQTIESLTAAVRATRVPLGVGQGFIPHLFSTGYKPILFLLR